MIIKRLFVSISLFVSINAYASDLSDIAETQAETIEEQFSFCATIAEKEAIINAIIESANNASHDLDDTAGAQERVCIKKLTQDLARCMQELIKRCHATNDSSKD